MSRSGPTRKHGQVRGSKEKFGQMRERNFAALVQWKPCHPGPQLEQRSVLPSVLLVHNNAIALALFMDTKRIPVFLEENICECLESVSLLTCALWSEIVSRRSHLLPVCSQIPVCVRTRWKLLTSIGMSAQTGLWGRWSKKVHGMLRDTRCSLRRSGVM